MTPAPTPSLRRLAGALLALAVVPALAFAAAQLFVQSESESELALLRDEQLDGLLFSVNQNAWDVASTWAERLSWIRADGAPTDLSADAIGGFLASVSSVAAVVVADTSLVEARVYERSRDPYGSSVVKLRRDLPPHGVRALLTQRDAGYRKLEPFTFGDQLWLVFVAGGQGDADGPARVLCVIVEPEPFVRDVVMPKLREVALGGVALGVFTDGADAPLAATGPLVRADVERDRPLWLLPAHSVGARVGEGSAEALMRRRLLQTLLLLGGVTLVLGAGTWAVWRGVRREMEVARLREGFVSNVSHELRTPLALIRLYSESLAAGRVPEAKQQRYYDTLVAETERLSRLVGNVLHFDRFQRDAARLALESLDLGALATEIAVRYRPVVERDGCTLTTDITQPATAQAESLVVSADRDAISEALVNLLDNAVKYGGPGEVTLSVTRDAGLVVVAVADGGPGVSVPDRERVFEPFVRVQPDSADGLVHTAKGTGLGLALVRRIALAHGGTATVGEGEDGGAVFRLSIPAAPTPAVPSSPAPSSPDSPSDA